MVSDPRAEEALAFWFADTLESSEAANVRSGVWFGSDPVFDDEIRKRFGELPDLALAGVLDEALGRDSREEEVRCLAEGGDRF